MTDINSYTPDQLAQLELPAKVLLSTDGEQFTFVTLEQWSKGWATVSVGEGEQQKVRASSLYPVEEEATADGRRMAQILAKYRTGYTPAVAASGKKSLHNGDEVAQALEYLELGAVYHAASMALIVDEDELRARYQHLNLGQQRMNLGNRIRAAVKRGEISALTWLEGRLLAICNRADRD